MFTSDVFNLHLQWRKSLVLCIIERHYIVNWVSQYIHTFTQPEGIVMETKRYCMYISNMYTHTFITFLASIGSTCICKTAKQHSIKSILAITPLFFIFFPACMIDISGCHPLPGAFYWCRRKLGPSAQFPVDNVTLIWAAQEMGKHLGFLAFLEGTPFY